MRAAICTAYGGPDVVVLRDIDKPLPDDNSILVRVLASTVSAADSRVRGSRFPPGFGLAARLFFGLARPRRPVLGSECAGIVEAVGAGVTRFRSGDAVVGLTGARFGCHAEYVSLPEEGAVAKKPPGIDFEHAAALVFGGSTALHFLRGRGKISAGERVLINGASGAVGISAVQLAKHFGAHVTAVCSAANADAVKAHGADEVIDYAVEDFAQSGKRWDIIADTVGTATFTRCKNVLNERGRLLLIAAGLKDLLKAPLQSLFSGRSVDGGPAPERSEDIAFLMQLGETGALKAVIDSRYPFERITEAHARTDTGRKVGSVVLNVSDA